MKPLLLFFLLVPAYACKKTGRSESSFVTDTKPNVTMTDLEGDYWKVFRVAAMSSKKYSRWPDTTRWVQYENLVYPKSDRVMLFRNDSTYECDKDIAFALFISQKGKFIPNKENEFDSVQFLSPYANQKVGIRKLVNPANPADYQIDLNVHELSGYFNLYGNVLLEQVK